MIGMHTFLIIVADARLAQVFGPHFSLQVKEWSLQTGELGCILAFIRCVTMAGTPSHNRCCIQAPVDVACSIAQC